MRLVLDTNVIVSALIWAGEPYKLTRAATEGDVELCTSPALLAELREVLSRGNLAERLSQQRSTVDQAIEEYGELAIGVSPLATRAWCPTTPTTTMSSPRPWLPRQNSSSAETATC